jgi:glycosyltransferase involved in cell wall biosynthesis
LPVVATAVGGNVEVLAHGGGELVPPQNPDALAAALLTMLSDEEYRVATGASGSAAVSEHFSMQAMVTGWDSVYRSMLASS